MPPHVQVGRHDRGTTKADVPWERACRKGRRKEDHGRGEQIVPTDGQSAGLMMCRARSPLSASSWENLQVLRDELANEFSFRDVHVLDQRLQRGPGGLIQPQHEACAIDPGIMGPLLKAFRLPTGRNIVVASRPVFRSV
jgi:hypothetical protein